MNEEPTKLEENVLRLIAKIARLNPDCGEIGAGMLAQIVEEARRIEKRKVSR